MNVLGNYEVLFAHFGPDEQVSVPKEYVWSDCCSIDMAVARVAVNIEDNDVSGRDLFGGIVRDETKQPVAVVTMRGGVQTVEQAAEFIENAKALMGMRWQGERPSPPVVPFVGWTRPTPTNTTSTRRATSRA
jgi:hypothetical protein